MLAARVRAATAGSPRIGRGIVLSFVSGVAETDALLRRTLARSRRP
jgi:hypothetical protein